jgi:alginate O-acetyltransferase complex protein AlgI
VYSTAGSSELTVVGAWMGALAFSLQLYFDFSGYSDMAIGLGRIFGFHFSENFNYPYISKSATEFWRRWHMSLGTWFRDYVYIPLGGNRVSKPRWFFNIFVVWFLTGFWHGAAWNFIIWGLFFAVLLIVEKVFLLKYLNKSKVISRIYTLVAVGISFVIFNATDMKEALSYIGGMFGAGDVPFVSTEFFYYLKSFAVALVIGVIGATPIVKRTVEKIFENNKISKFIWVLEPVGLVVLLAVMTAYLVDGSFNPFLYFRF